MDTNRITENEYLLLSEEFKNKIEQKNQRLRKLEESIILSWAMISKYNRDGDESYLSDLKDVLTETLESSLNLTEI